MAVDIHAHLQRDVNNKYLVDELLMDMEKNNIEKRVVSVIRGNCINDMNKVRERAGLPLWLDPQKSKKEGKPRHVTPHGMRACLRTWTELTAHGNYARFNPNIVERCLDHAAKDRFGGAYYRQGLSADDEHPLVAMNDVGQELLHHDTGGAALIQGFDDAA